MDFMKGGKMVKKSGFTLAEVLVTLTIIGTVAAMTVPSLMNSTAAQENTAGYKKMISTLNQAITMQFALEGTDMKDFTFVRGAESFANPLGLGQMFQDRLQVVRTLDTREAADGHPNGTNQAVVLSDGSVIEIPNALFKSESCQARTLADLEEDTVGGFRTATNDTCLYSIIVDVNGNKSNCVLNLEEPQEDLNAPLVVRDCFYLDVYPTEVRPGDWTGRMIMYNNSRPMDDREAAAGPAGP